MKKKIIASTCAAENVSKRWVIGNGHALQTRASTGASFGNISPLGEGPGLAGAFGEALAGGAAIPNTDRQGAPKAYLQYIVFDKDMSMAQHGYSMATNTALTNWQKLELEVPIEENGYIYIYVANESMENVNVYFDDMEVQLIDAPVTSASDYYPFGLAIKSRSYSSEPYRFGYQGQFAEMDEETGWNSFELRMFEPVIGRWMSTDPAGQFYSPYLGMGNNPVIGIDPDGGDCPTCPANSKYDDYHWSEDNFVYHQDIDQVSYDIGDVTIIPSTLNHIVDFGLNLPNRTAKFAENQSRDILNTGLYIGSGIGMPIINALGGGEVDWAKVYTLDKTWNWQSRELDNGTLDEKEFKEMLHYSSNVSIGLISAGTGSILNTSKPVMNKVGDYLIKKTVETILQETNDQLFLNYHK